MPTTTGLPRCLRSVFLYTRLEIRLKTQFARESVHSVLVGEVNLALVTAPPQDAQITAVSFAPAPLYAVLPEDHPVAHKESLLLQDLAKDEWILFPKRFDPVVFDAVMDAAQSGSIVPKYAHDVIAPQQAVELVSEHLGGRRWDEYRRRNTRAYSSMSREVLSALRITHVLKHNEASESGFKTTPSA